MSAFYNENDAQKAAWLRELIKAHVIAPGEVDERSITDVRAEDLRGFVQCHFFAGIGVWSYALRLAGWPDDRPVWTGSCPCPSFSCAGKGKGFDDPRHLWPAWFGLIRVGRPPTLFGEQADDAIGFGWLDLVQTDLEGQAYSVGKAVLGACSVGAPHIRQRLYFCAHPDHAERNRRPEEKVRTRILRHASDDYAPRYSPNSNGRITSNRDLQGNGEQRLLTEDCGTGEREHSAKVRSKIRPRVHGEHDGMLAADGCESGDSADSAESGRRARIGNDDARKPNAERCGDDVIGSQSERTRLEGHSGHERNGNRPGWLDADTARSVAEAGATRGFWGNCDWWYGRDGKYRPIKCGVLPLVTRTSGSVRQISDYGVEEFENTPEARILRLRGYGDSIVPQVAAKFVSAYMEVTQ